MIEYQGRNITLIGEVKTRTASGSFLSPHSWNYLFQLANEDSHVDIISILIGPTGHIAFLLVLRVLWVL